MEGHRYLCGGGLESPSPDPGFLDVGRGIRRPGYTIPIVATSGNPKVFDEHWWAQFQSWSCLRGFEALYGRVVGVTNCRSEQMESSMDHQEFQRSALESFIPQRFRRRSFGLSIGMFERP